MPLRKQNSKAAKKRGKTTASNSSPSAKTAVHSSQDIAVDIRPEKKYSWIVEQVKRELQHKRKTQMPRNLKPTLATAIDEPFNDADWQFEIKWDGYRSIAYIGDGQAELFSRNNLSFNRKYPSLVKALKDWPVNVVVDGEIVILSDDGKADFSALQAWDKKPEGDLYYFLFDILWMEGIDLQNEPLHVRRDILRRVVPEGGPIRFSDCIEQYGIDFFKAAKENGLEGIIAKRTNSLYKSGQRTKDWVKVKAEKRHEAIICGFTKNKNTDRLFSSLILGIPNGERLQFIGQVGTGFSASMQTQIMKKLRPLTTHQCPFEILPAINANVQWLQPKFICEVKYTELTKDGLMRHPSFQGLREDKDVAEFNLLESEAPVPTGTKKQSVTTSIKDDSSTIKIDGQEVNLTNLSKPYWRKEKITKGDMLRYYVEIAPYMLPYMTDRPQSLNRFPNGAEGENFYQKNMKGKVEPWLKTFERLSESDGEGKDFLVCTNTASLLYMANLGCIEMNPWHSRVQSPSYPDWCVIDLDPGRISFEKVIETAQMVHIILEDLNIPSFPKTSGSTGIHIYIPLGAKYNYEQSRQLAELVATLVHAELPSFTSLVRNPEKRKDKIYIDYLQNRPIQTICAPYSLRPKPGATVSAPLHWSEVKKGLQLSQFTIHNMLQRIKKEGDLFNGVLQKRIDLNDVLQRLSVMI